MIVAFPAAVGADLLGSLAVLLIVVGLLVLVGAALGLYLWLA